jgi:hypothetical protein
MHSLYEVEVTGARTNGTRTEPAPIQEDLIRLQLNAHERLEPVSVLFNHYLDHITDRGERRQFKFATRPTTLAICLERGYTDNNGYRHIVRDPVEGIDAGLTLLPGSFLTGPEAHYDPVACIIQKGSFTGGHYVACIKKEDGRWFLCNDAKVYEICEEEAHHLMKDCYLFFATRV